MLFNSPEFLFFFLPMFLFFTFLADQRYRNIILLIASIIFYFATSGQLTVVLLFSILANHVLAKLIWRSSGRVRKAWMIFAVVFNILPLIWYKYIHLIRFMAIEYLNFIHAPAVVPDVNPILPIGISFFTFQAISYVVDVYWARVEPARSLIDFGMYHSSFPQLVAGPIVRYEEIETEVKGRSPRLDDIHNGAVQFCLGLGKKVIFADGVGPIADELFGLPHAALNPITTWVGVLAYTLQIYFDFSGYSDMAIGLGRILGFHFPRNFDQPYRSRSITEFWRRWHMTLSRWFRDYVYIPLGGNRLGTGQTLRNLVIVFFLCGLWHGAGFTFVVWGLYHGFLLVAERLGRRLSVPTPPAFVGWLYSLVAVMVGWVFFRANSLDEALAYLRTMFTLPTQVPTDRLAHVLGGERLTVLLVASAFALLPYEYFLQVQNNRYEFGKRWTMAAVVVFLSSILVMSASGFTPFIYFRF